MLASCRNGWLGFWSGRWLRERHSLLRTKNWLKGTTKRPPAATAEAVLEFVLAEHRLIAPGQTYRMAVADASVAVPGGAQVYQGHEAGGPALFATAVADPDSELP